MDLLAPRPAILSQVAYLILTLIVHTLKAFKEHFLGSMPCRTSLLDLLSLHHSSLRTIYSKDFLLKLLVLCITSIIKLLPDVLIKSLYVQVGQEHVEDFIRHFLRDHIIE
jgi:hypothetical protein